MAYIGKGLVGVLSENKAVDTMSNPNGVLTTMTLSRTPGSVNNVEVYIDGIFQTPGDEFTLAGDVLTFTTAPATNAVVIAVVGNDSTIANVDNNTITGTMFPDGSVTDSKISDIVSTKISGTLPALDGSSLTNLTAGNLEGTLPALDGSPLTGVQGFRKNASDPLVNSNGNQGDVWVNTASGEVYVLTDATTNANVWTNVGSGTGNIPVPVSLASGGTLTTDGDYNVHTFNTSSQLTFSLADAPVEYLVIAGGGAGGGRDGTGNGAGGGAGGYRTATGFSVTAQTYGVTVGGGGAGVGTGRGTKGDDSVFSSITSEGGGGGGHYNAIAGGDGGSGGGGGQNSGSGGTATNSGAYGNNGGAGAVNTTSGGGGGAGAVGVAGVISPSQLGGAGGAGLASSITGSAVTRAGGGGGTYNGAGGSGGGGTGTGSSGGTSGAGTVNTGSGGGGALVSGTSAAGGSGVVIVRYRAR